ncbi:hypothetical protein [Gracilinema caldarium]|uniref:Lipoprotein n=1 Tax=Gracilinema caldarium (strain ATCC 51460 / DSM 7334 / H1) TaxID=744872 RepID=F8EXQ2_GRAC1|nr:hypothetical protein [Gracilinema caldarium]AEJ19633.1 hypothetical protein Spica_1489 [Gracilinema caldarium DSM 7334]
MKLSMKLYKIGLLSLGVLVVLSFTSCIGLNSTVTIRQNGSGTIQLEYRLSRMFEALGKLDGNEKQLPLPVSRTDFERTLSRVPGLTLNSYSLSQDQKNVIVKAELAFANLEALMGFLDASGQSVKLISEGDNRVMSMVLVKGIKNVDKDLENLVHTIFTGYTIDVRFTYPSPPLVSASGKIGQATVTGTTVRYTSSVSDLVLSPEPVELRLSWKE